MTTIILCGGVGARLWPLSRATMPKQFAAIVPGGSLFEGAVRRNRVFGGNVLVAANRDQSGLAAAQLRGLGVNGWLSMVEPVGRNTAPAIALSCMMLPPGEVVLVVPSDHLIRGQSAYELAVSRAASLAEAGRLVTFGIQPAYPETGYGYIETDGETVVSFREKPDAATAAGYVASGRYLWNSGMFCFRAGTFLDELRTHAPAVYDACRAACNAAPDGSASGAATALAAAKNPVDKDAVVASGNAGVPEGSVRVLAPPADAMAAIPSISVDYAVMEKSVRVSCVACPAELGWSDLGSWDALYDELSASGAPAQNAAPEATGSAPPPATIPAAPGLHAGAAFVVVGSAESDRAPVAPAPNAASGTTDPLFIQAAGNLVVSTGRRVVIVDADDLVVVETPDAVLVTRRGSTQKVKDAVDALRTVDPGLL